jgi:type I pantothenate kinase
MASVTPIAGDQAGAGYAPLAQLILERRARAPSPFVVGITGSVAVGKTAAAHILHALLVRRMGNPRGAVLTTDGFLLPNAVLAARGLMLRKGFPESYDLAALTRFIASVRGGAPEVRAPVYSHLAYDVVPDEFVVVRRPDVLIVEGLHVSRVLFGDLLDLSVYIDAAQEDIRRWYVERFLRLGRAPVGAESAVETALHIWSTVNEPNLVEHILATLDLADVVVVKGPDHAVQAVRVRSG